MAKGPYNFEFFRCIHCGTTISVYDTEPCCNPQAARAKREGKAMAERLSKSTKTLVRLLRRARAHGIVPWHIIRAEDNGRQATALFANRHIRVRDDGSMIPDMLPRCAQEGGTKSDPHWKASMYARMYEADMAHVAYLRRMRWYESARTTIMSARVLRWAGANE